MRGTRKSEIMITKTDMYFIIQALRNAPRVTDITKEAYEKLDKDLTEYMDDSDYYVIKRAPIR